MTEEILKRIDALAAKLGVAANHLWGVLTKQAYIEAVYGIVFVSFALLGVFYGASAFCRGLTYERKDRDDATGAAMSFGGGVLLAISIMILGAYAHDIGYFFNPEYYALQQITKLLK